MAWFDFFRGKAKSEMMKSLPMVSYINTVVSNFGYGEKSEGVDQYKGWAYACVKSIAEKVATVELQLMRRAGDEIEIVNEHPVLNLLRDVNPFLTKHDLFQSTQSYLELDGNAFWWLNKNKAGEIIAIWPLRPDYVTAVPDQDLFVKHYVYTIGNEKFILPIDSIIHFKEFNPKNPFRGLGSVTAAMSAIEQDNFARDWNKEFFKNNATPGGILQFDGNLTPPEHKKLENEWNDRYKGATKAHRTAVLAGGLKFTPTSSTQHDMDFVNLRTFSRDEVLALFRVPKTVLGITDGTQTRASAETSEYVFMKETIKPKMKKIVDTLNEFLLTMYEEDGLYFSFTDPVPQNRELALSEYQNGLANGWLSINEVRRREGLPDVSNGDAVMVPFSLSPLGEPIKAVKIEKPKSKIEQAVHEIAMVVAPAIKVVADMQAFEKRGEVHWKAQIGRGTPYEKQVAKTMDDFFSTQLERVLKALDKKLKSIKRNTKAHDVFDDASEEEALIKAVKAIFATIVAAEGTAALEEIGLDEVFNDRTERVQRALVRHLKKFAGAVTEETSKQIRTAISEGLAAGEDLRGVRKRVEELSAFGRPRSEVIARTEVIRAQNFASIQAWKESGLVEKKIWWTALDERVEEECASRHGEEYDLEENVDKGNSYGVILAPPLHPNCVVGSTIIVSPDAEKITRAWYEGPLTELIFADGRQLTVTPNHVLLTTRGFVSAQFLCSGDKILKASILDGIIDCDPNTNDCPATIEKVVDALSMAGSVTTTRMPVSSEYLHGDGRFIDSHIDIITPYGSLSRALESSRDKTVQNFAFNPTYAKTSQLSCKSNLASMLLALSATADGIVSGASVSDILFSGSLTRHQTIRFYSAANYDARMKKARKNSGSSNLEAVSEFLLRYPALVQTDELIDVNTSTHKGFVYDVNTTSQLYTANGYITSNCRCTLLPVVTSKSQSEVQSPNFTQLTTINT